MSESSTSSPRRHTAGLLDIRNIIGTLIGAYGVILTLMGLFADQAPDKTGDVNANLWAGLVMIVVGLVFVTGAGLRRVVVPEHHDRPHDDPA